MRDSHPIKLYPHFGTNWFVPLVPKLKCLHSFLVPFQNGKDRIGFPTFPSFSRNPLFVEVMTDLPVPQTTIMKGFYEGVGFLLVGGITGGIVLWIQIVESDGNLKTEVVGILVIGKVKTVLTYSTVTDLARFRG